jgi:hypothetical protein
MGYFVGKKPKGEWWSDQPAPPLGHPQVFVQEPVDTGLLNEDGKPIYRGPDRIGFIKNVGG